MNMLFDQGMNLFKQMSAKEKWETQLRYVERFIMITIVFQIKIHLPTHIELTSIFLPYRDITYIFNNKMVFDEFKNFLLCMF